MGPMHGLLNPIESLEWPRCVRDLVLTSFFGVFEPRLHVSRILFLVSTTGSNSFPKTSWTLLGPLKNATDDERREIVDAFLRSYWAAFGRLRKMAV